MIGGRRILAINDKDSSAMRHLTEAEIVARYPRIRISDLSEDDAMLIRSDPDSSRPGRCYGNAMQFVFFMNRRNDVDFRDASARYVLAFGVGERSIFTHGMAWRAGRYIDATLKCDWTSAFYVVAEYTLDDILRDGRVDRTGSEEAPAIRPPCLHPDGTVGYGEIRDRAYGQWPR